VLLHEFRAVDDDPTNTALIKQMVDRNSTAELAALRNAAELGEQITTLVHSFADSVVIEAPLRDVYRFLSRAQDWDQMAHISRVVLDEAVPNVQTLELDSPGIDGTHQTTRMIRVCFPYHSIFYKQTQPPDAMLAHVGRWQLFPTADGVRVTAHNTIMIRPGQAADGLQPARAELTADAVRHLLRENCMAILLHGKDSASSWIQLPRQAQRPG
jgi:aromatase